MNTLNLKRVRRAMTWLGISLCGLWLQGCHDPLIITSLSTDLGFQGETIDMVINGEGFDISAVDVAVDGYLGPHFESAGPSPTPPPLGVQIVKQFEENDSRIHVTLKIAPDAMVGQHIIAVVRDNEWVSNTVHFEVRCAGCALPPRLANVYLPSGNVYDSSAHRILRFVGTNLNNVHQIDFSPKAVSQVRDQTIEAHDQGSLQYFDLTVEDKFLLEDGILAHPGLVTVSVVTAGGQSNQATFTLDGSEPPFGPTNGGPFLGAVLPTHIGKGAEVFIKCSGRGFGTNRLVITDPVMNVTTYSVASDAANPDEVVVAKISNNASVSGPIRVRVQNVTENTLSDEFVIFSDEPAPGAPVAQGATGNGVHRGGSFDLEIFGANLEGISNASWSGIPGLTFSNTMYGSFRTKVHIVADATAPLTTNEATNLTITIPDKGQSAPFLFRVFP